MAQVIVYRGYGYGRYKVGYIENDKIYKYSGGFIDECVGQCYYYKIYNGDRFGGESLALYDEKYLYMENWLGKTEAAYIENGRIYESEYPHKCIGEYEGYAEGSCISLLLCDFYNKYSTVTNYDNDYSSSQSSISYTSSKDGNNVSSYNTSSKDSGSLSISGIIGIIVFVLIFIFIGIPLLEVVVNVGGILIFVILAFAIFFN